MFSKWIEEYQKVSQDWRVVPRLGSFIIAIFTLLSLYDVGWGIYYNQTVLEENRVFVCISFQVAILITFIARFSLSFFTTVKVFWFSQILWLFGISLFIAYWDYSKPKSAIEFAIFHRGIFGFSSNYFDLFGSNYLFLSPLLRGGFAVISFVKSLKRND